MGQTGSYVTDFVFLTCISFIFVLELLNVLGGDGKTFM